MCAAPVAIRHMNEVLQNCHAKEMIGKKRHPPCFRESPEQRCGSSRDKKKFPQVPIPRSYINKCGKAGYPPYAKTDCKGSSDNAETATPKLFPSVHEHRAVDCRDATVAACCSRKKQTQVKTIDFFFSTRCVMAISAEDA